MWEVKRGESKATAYPKEPGSRSRICAAPEPPRGHVRVVYLGPVAPHWEVESDFGDRMLIEAFVVDAVDLIEDEIVRASFNDAIGQWLQARKD